MQAGELAREFLQYGNCKLSPHAMVPTTYNEMFKFNSAVMGFQGYCESILNDYVYEGLLDYGLWT